MDKRTDCEVRWKTNPSPVSFEPDLSSQIRNCCHHGDFVLNIIQTTLFLFMNEYN